jgi:hypothetical protein
MIATAAFLGTDLNVNGGLLVQAGTMYFVRESIQVMIITTETGIEPIMQFFGCPFIKVFQMRNIDLG